MVFALYRFCITVSILLFFSISSSAQNVIKLAFAKKLNSSTGLSSYNANQILQDRYGFIWIATQDGLNRYDGNEFIIYSKSSPEKRRLLSTVINTMLLDPQKDILWTTTSYGGLNGIDLVSGEVIHALPSKITKDGFQNNWLKCMNICLNELWIGTYDGFVVYDPEKRKFVKADPLPWQKKPGAGYNITFVFVDRYNHVSMFLPDYGLAVYSGSSHKLLRFYTNNQLRVHETFGFMQFTSRIAPLGDTSFIWGNDKGFRIISFDSSAGITIQDSALKLNQHFGQLLIYACAMDKNERLWFATEEALFAGNVRTGAYERVKDIAGNSQSDWLRNIFNIFFDDQDNVWIGAQNGAAFAKNKSPAFVPYYEDAYNKLKISHVNHMYAENDSILYVGSQNGLFRLNMNTERLVSIDSSMSCIFIFKNPDKNIIVSGSDLLSGRNGLYVLKPSGKIIPIHHVYPKLRSISHALINGVVFLSDTTVIMSTENSLGIYIWNLRTDAVQNLLVPSDSFPHSFINGIYKDKRNRVWILFDDAIVVMEPNGYATRKFSITDPDLKMPMNLFFDLCEAGNYYWMAVYGKGVVQLDADFNIKKIYSLPQGLTNTGVYKVMPYADSVIFCTTNNGIFSINIKTQKVLHYLKDDGLNTNSFEERSGNMRGNILFAGGVDGVSKIDPRYLNYESRLPKMYINKVETQAEDTSNEVFDLNLKHLKIANDVLQTTVHFSAIDFSNRTQTIFSRRIRKLGDEWVHLKDQFTDIMDLPPGTYTIEIKASNGDNSYIKSIDLTFRPKWYETLGFKLAVILVTLSLLYGIYRYRQIQIRKQQQIRKSIASDLHDDIGSTLNTVKVFTHLAKREPKKEEFLSQIEDLLLQATTGLRDMIWVLEDSQETVQELADRIKKFAIPVTSAKGIHFECIVDFNSGSKLLSRAEKRNLLLVAKESINNSIKYAECNSIALQLKQSEGKMKLIIKDDGKGFDLSTPSFGNGLKNIQYRAKQIHFTAVITSAAGEGTTITVEKK